MVCNILLDIKKIFPLPIVLVGPKVVAISNIDQLSRDPEMLAELPDAALQHGLHIELFPNLDNISMLATKAE